jgi:hypothetical protein
MMEYLCPLYMQKLSLLTEALSWTLAIRLHNKPRWLAFPYTHVGLLLRPSPQ